MQWLINEFKDFKTEVSKKIDQAIAEQAGKHQEASERIQKLEGEIRAMKARMGKNKE